MKVGLLWFDDDARTTLEDKVLKAAAYYKHKYGKTPNLCFIHPGAFNCNGNGNKLASGVEIRPLCSVLRHHFWIGVETRPTHRGRDPVTTRLSPREDTQ